MSTITQPAPAVNVNLPASAFEATPDPWYADRHVYTVEVGDLPFGARVTLRDDASVVHKVVRAPERLDPNRRYTLRVRRVAADGSLVGPVLSVTLDQVAGLVKPEPAPAPSVDDAVDNAPAPAATPWPEMFATGRVVARGDASWLPATSRIQAVVQRDMVRHALMEMGATLPPDDEPASQNSQMAKAEPACCPDDEPAPCSSCLAHDGPADLSDDAWDDGHVWAPSDDDEPFAGWIRRQADAYARMGTARASWLARRIAALAERADFLDADSPDAFDDKLTAMMDAARDAAEARAAARCC